MKTFKKIVAVSLCAAILVGCGGSSNSGKKIINVAALNDVITMDSSYATDGDSFTALRLANEGLYYVDQDNQPKFGVAEKVEKSEDGKVYTFTLRKEAKWSNGDTVTAGDFVYAWSRLADPKRGSEYAYMLGEGGINCLNGEAVIAGDKPLTDLGIKAINDSTLEITLEAPCAYFESLMSFPTFYPINEKFAVEQDSQYASSPDKMLSNGPYTVTTWEQGSVMKLEKNKTYWAEDEIKLDGINLQVRKDTNSAVLGFKSGEIDYCPITGEMTEEYKDKPELFQKLTGYYWYAVPNISKVPELQNKNLRMALALSYDKDSLVNDVLNDGSKAANFLVPYQIAALDGEDFREAGGSYLEFDLKKAQEYLETAKKELGKTEFSYEFLVDDDEIAQKTAQYLQEQWEKNLPGVKISLKPLPKKSRQDLIKPSGNRDFQIVFTRWGPDYSDPTTYTNLFATKEGTFNYGEWANEKYTSLIQKATIGEDGVDLEDRWKDLLEAEKILLDDAAIFPVYQLGGSSLKNTKLKNLYYSPVNNECFRYCELED